MVSHRRSPIWGVVRIVRCRRMWGDRALREVTGPNKPVRDVICMLSPKDLDRLSLDPPVR